VVHLEAVPVVEVQREGVVDPHGGKVSHRALVRQSENVGKEPCRRFLIVRGHNRVIQRDRHRSTSSVLDLSCAVQVTTGGRCSPWSVAASDAAVYFQTHCLVYRGEGDICQVSTWKIQRRPRARLQTVCSWCSRRGGRKPLPTSARSWASPARRPASSWRSSRRPGWSRPGQTRAGSP